MKLTRLRLHGFKSFVEPTDFHIEPGLTGVVGPNGCGKSNLVEALRPPFARENLVRHVSLGQSVGNETRAALPRPG